MFDIKRKKNYKLTVEKYKVNVRRSHLLATQQAYVVDAKIQSKADDRRFRQICCDVCHQGEIFNQTATLWKIRKGRM